MYIVVGGKMPLEITLEQIRNISNSATFERWGDDYEKTYGHYLKNSFPNCEKFWSLFVVPITNRVNSNITNRSQLIHKRNGIDKKVQEIANYHYSIFMHLIYAHVILESKSISKLEDVLSHLASTCDLVEDLIANWYLLLCECRSMETKVLHQLTLEEFLNDYAKRWYEKYYKRSYQYYYSKGKDYPIKLLDISTSLAEEYIGQTSEYFTFALNIRQYRNHTIHNIILSRIVTSPKVYIPKIDRILDYRNWEEVESAAGKSEKFEQDFIELENGLSLWMNKLEQLLNQVWEKLIEDLLIELDSKENNSMYKKMNLMVLLGDSNNNSRTNFHPPILPMESANSAYMSRSDETVDNQNLEPYNGGSFTVSSGLTNKPEPTKGD